MIETKTHGRLGNLETPTRGIITEFSKKSRLRMLRLLHSITFDNPLLVTLTYKDIVNNSREYHDDLRAFRQVLERMYGKTRVVWKLEFQKRGAPHFHLLLLDIRKVDIPALGSAWCRIAGITGQDGTWQAFDVKDHDRDGNDLRNPAAYAAKYVGKEVIPDDYQGFPNPGRFWGVWNVRRERGISLVLPDDEAENASTIIREALGFQDKPYEGYSPFGNTVFVGNVGSRFHSLDLVEKLLDRGYNPVMPADMELSE